MRTLRIALLALGCVATGCGDDGGAAGTDLSIAPADLALVGVGCGAETCSGPDQNCCVSLVTGSVSAKCVFPGYCSYGSVLRCDGPEDCTTSQVCCGTISLGGGGNADGGAVGLPAASMCAGSCDFNLNQVPVTTRLCHLDAECAGLTASGQPARCCSSETAPWLHFCAVATSGVSCP